MHLRRIVVLLLLAAALESSAAARECPAISGGDSALSQLDANERLRFITGALDDDYRKSRLWFWAWMGGYSALAAGQLALVPAWQPEERIDLYVGAAATIAGFGSLLLFPPAALKQAPKLRARLATITDECAALADAEATLDKVAKAEDDAHGWLMHTLNIGYNVGVGLVLVFWPHHYQSGALNAVAGAVIGEVFINTQPAIATEALRRYRAGNLGSTRRTGLSWYVLPAISPDSIGLRAGAAF